MHVFNTKKVFRKYHTFESPDFFDLDKIINKYITNHVEKFVLYLFKSDFKLVFNNFAPHIKTHFNHNTTINKLKRYRLYWIEFFIKRGHKYFLIDEMNITTINDKMNKTYEQFIKQPMQAVDLRLKYEFCKKSPSNNFIY